VRRVAALAALGAALLAAAAPARAQSRDATPVAGGGSFNAAPLLEPGTYRDTVLTGEYLYYALAVEAGQRVHVRARILDVDPDVYSRATVLFSINLHTPQRETLSSPVDEDVAGNGNTDGGIVVTRETGAKPLRWDFYGPPAQPFAESADASTYEGPGTWYVSLHPVEPDTALRIELPVELELDVEGAPVPEERDPRPAPTPTPSPSPAAEAEDGGAGALSLLGLGALGLAVGLVAGRALARR
jgi:Ca-activated chloride channel homolog